MMLILLKRFKNIFILLLIVSVFPLSVTAESQQQKIQKKIEQASSSLHSAQSKSKKLSRQVIKLEKDLSDISNSQYRTEKKWRN